MVAEIAQELMTVPLNDSNISRALRKRIEHAAFAVSLSDQRLYLEAFLVMMAALPNRSVDERRVYA